MAGRRAFTRGSSRQRRPNIWTGGFGPPVSLAAGAIHTITLVSNAEVQNRTSPTVTRMRGELNWNPGSTHSAEVVAGIIVLDESARSGGSMPSPEVDLSAPWLWWSYSSITLISEVRRVIIDSKAQRKMRDSEVLVLRILNTGSAAITHSEGVRVLLKD